MNDITTTQNNQKVIHKLVEVHGGEVFTDSHTIARNLGVQHYSVVTTIKSMLDDYPDLRPITNGAKLSPISADLKQTEKFYTEKRTYRKQTYTVYIFNRPFFSLLVMRFKTKKARECQRNFNNAFYEMERRILNAENNANNEQWKLQREQGKLARKSETDVIKDFVEYATNQGSKSAKFYYKHITNACYKCLQLVEHKKPKIRDTLDILQLNQLMLAEVVAERSLRKHMAESKQYKEIFNLVKCDLEMFAQSIMIGFNDTNENDAA